MRARGTTDDDDVLEKGWIGWGVYVEQRGEEKKDALAKGRKERAVVWDRRGFWWGTGGGCDVSKRQDGNWWLQHCAPSTPPPPLYAPQQCSDCTAQTQTLGCSALLSVSVWAPAVGSLITEIITEEEPRPRPKSSRNVSEELEQRSEGSGVGIRAGSRWAACWYVSERCVRVAVDGSSGLCVLALWHGVALTVQHSNAVVISRYVIWGWID